MPRRLGRGRVGSDGYRGPGTSSGPGLCPPQSPALGGAGRGGGGAAAPALPALGLLLGGESWMRSGAR